MLIIKHRTNSSSELKVVPYFMGVELDLRSANGNIHIHHDVFEVGESLEHWISEWAGQFLIFNVKEDGLEEKTLEIVHAHGVRDYFFLDQPFPSMRKMILGGNSRVAARASNLESIETVLASGAEWCWLDNFSNDWTYLLESIPALVSHGIKTCLVSPELQRVDSLVELNQLQALIADNSLQVDAVCTKEPTKWS